MVYPSVRPRKCGPIKPACSAAARRIVFSGSGIASTVVILTCSGPRTPTDRAIRTPRSFNVTPTVQFRCDWSSAQLIASGSSVGSAASRLEDKGCLLTQQANRRPTRGRKPACGRPVERRVRPVGQRGLSTNGSKRESSNAAKRWPIPAKYSRLDANAKNAAELFCATSIAASHRSLLGPIKNAPPRP
jgi:hypothetical protein